MRIHRRFLSALGLACAASVWAQPSDSAKEASAAAPEKPAVPAAPPDSIKPAPAAMALPVPAAIPAPPAAMHIPAPKGARERRVRKNAVAVELGLNGLASPLGFTASYYFTPRMAVDYGAGFGITGFRPGLRLRHNFSPGRVSPFMGWGFKYGFGFGTRTAELEDRGTQTKYRYRLKQSPFLDFDLGLDFQARGGFHLLWSLGWSQLMRDKNWEVTEGGPISPKETKFLNDVLETGPVFSLALGRAF